MFVWLMKYVFDAGMVDHVSLTVCDYILLLYWLIGLSLYEESVTLKISYNVGRYPSEIQKSIMKPEIQTEIQKSIRKPEIHPEIWKSNLKLKIHAKMTQESYLQISEYLKVFMSLGWQQVHRFSMT